MFSSFQGHSVLLTAEVDVEDEHLGLEEGVRIAQGAVKGCSGEAPGRRGGDARGDAKTGVSKRATHYRVMGDLLGRDVCAEKVP